MRMPAPMATSSCVNSNDRLVTRDNIVQGGPAIMDTSEAILATADLNNRHVWPVTQGNIFILFLQFKITIYVTRMPVQQTSECAI